MSAFSYRRRRRPSLLGACLLLAGAPVAHAEPLQPGEEARARLQRIVETRGFTRGLPRRPLPSPDGAQVYFLRSGPRDEVQELHVFDVASRRTRLFLEAGRLAARAAISGAEQARRERARETEGGLTRFEISRDGRRMLVPYAGDLFLVDLPGGDVHRLTDTEAPEIDAHLAPDGTRVAFVRGEALCSLECAGGNVVVLAAADTPGLSYGTAEFVAQEEMGRHTGHWWSPDSRWLAFTEVDTRAVPSFQVPRLRDPRGAGSTSPYPAAGDANARVRLGIVAAAGGAIEWLDLGADVEYLARVHWSPKADALWVQTQPRDQKSLELRRIDLSSKSVRTVHREDDPAWVNLHDNFHCLDGGRRFLWSSERSGRRNLEIRDADGRLERVLTPDSLNVAGVQHVDERRGQAIFSAYGKDPRELHLFRADLGGGTLRRLSTAAGWNEAFFHEQGHDLWVTSRSDASTPPRFEVRRRSGSGAGELPSVALVPAAADLGPLPEYLQLAGADGERLDVRLLRPPAAPTTAPLVVYVYGGPHGQQVRRRWGGERELFDAWLAERGFFVARIDGRGAWGRGHASERVYAGRLGNSEVIDQVAAVEALTAQVTSIDAERIGIWGWSYGGYMTLMSLMRAPHVFRVGVAVAPVVDWRGYDTHYTERYLGLPRDNAAGYDSSSVLFQVPGLRGRLVVVHGASDDNVHLRESMLLAQELVQQGKPVELMIYPGTHMMQTEQERLHLYELVWRTFAEHL